MDRMPRRRGRSPLLPERILAPAWTTVLAGVALAGLVLAGPLVGQSAPEAIDGNLGSGPHASMGMLLEKSIFQVDVLRLDVRLGPDATLQLDSLIAAAGPDADSDDLSDAVAAIALEARDALTSIEFLRDVGLARFLQGIRDNLARAEEGGLITKEELEAISRALPEWYAFLRDRGIESGDRMLQRIRGDSLRTVYISAAGDTLLDQSDEGAHRRLAVLGGYFAPGSDFREGLVDSLLDTD